MSLKKKRGQSTLEYAVLIAVIVAALIAVQVYVKRGYQGRLRTAADDMGEQFSPGYTTSLYNVTTNTTSIENITAGVTILNTTQNVTRTGNETVANYSQEYWK